MSEQTKPRYAYKGELRTLNRTAGRQKLQQFDGAEWKDIPEAWEDSEIQARFEKLEQDLDINALRTKEQGPTNL